MIPVEDHLWLPLSYNEVPLFMPEGHRIEYAFTGEDEITVRITGPNAHVYGKDGTMDEAVDKALEWFARIGKNLG